MTISKLYIKRCKLTPIVTVLRKRNFGYTNVRAEPFYVHENQCTQILHLLSPVSWKPTLKHYHADSLLGIITQFRF